MRMTIYDAAGIAAVAFATSLLLTPPLGALARRVGLVDRPGVRKMHERATPLLGGAAVFAACLAGLLAAVVWIGGTPGDVASGLRPLRDAAPILLGGAFLLTIGILDDAGRVHSQVKLVAAMPLAALALVVTGFRLPVAGLSEPAAAALTGLWLVAVTAAFSIFDHMDGLCGGVGAIAALGYLGLSGMAGGAEPLAPLAAAVFGAAAGFVVWNFRPARIFLGDGGALFIGFVAGALALQQPGAEPAGPTAWMAPLLVLAVPLFDTSLVTVSRLRRGLVPFASPGKDHAAHRLANLGLGVRGAVLLLYGVAALGAVLAGTLADLSALARYGLLGAVAAIGAAGVAALERAPYAWQDQQEVRWRRPARSGVRGPDVTGPDAPRPEEAA